jgi:hypothetical protein
VEGLEALIGRRAARHGLRGVLGHNPLAALHTSGWYYRRLLGPDR